MFPRAGDLLGVAPDLPTHGLFVALGVLAAALVFVVEARRRGHTDERLVWVVTGALVGGAVLMRMGTWLQHVDLRANAGVVEQWAYGNRSVLGGLVGAWLGVHVAKRLVGYRLRTGDLFAPAVAMGMAVGRVGCLLTERPGTPTGTAFGITLDPVAAERLGAPAGVPLHPSFLYEVALPRHGVPRALDLAAAPAAAAGDDVRPLRRGLRGVPVRRRARPWQRGGLVRAHPAPAVPRRDGADRPPAGGRPRPAVPRRVGARVGAPDPSTRPEEVPA